jgi:hypothetical protein
MQSNVKKKKYKQESIQNFYDNRNNPSVRKLVQSRTQNCQREMKSLFENLKK